MHTMKLYVSAAGWMIVCSDPEVLKLFGTDTLPTAFTCNAKAGDVLAKITALNPDRQVSLLTG